MKKTSIKRITSIISRTKLAKTMLNKPVDISDVRKELTSLELAFNVIKK